MTSYWPGKNVLVTGATGMIGSGLVKTLLQNRAKVFALIPNNNHSSELFRSDDINQITTVNGKLEDYRTIETALSRHEIDTVFHLGAQTIVSVAHRSPLATFEANIRGTYNVLEACRIHRSLVKRVVIASSDKAYGSSQVLPYTEDMPLQGEYPYDVSKSCADLISQSYFYTYNLPLAIARCGNVFGAGDLNWSRIVPGTIRSLNNNEAPLIRSDGKYQRDYIYLDDIVDAYMLLGEALDDEKTWGASFNFSNGDPLSVIEIVAMIQEIMDKSKISPEILNTAKGEIKNQYLSAEKAKKALGWKPDHTIKAGLVKTIEWYQDFLRSSND